jgi:hypothetical protein
MGRSQDGPGPGAREVVAFVPVPVGWMVDFTCRADRTVWPEPLVGWLVFERAGAREFVAGVSRGGGVMAADDIASDTVLIELVGSNPAVAVRPA